jgi:hypothetical protein
VITKSLTAFATRSCRRFGAHAIEGHAHSCNAIARCKRRDADRHHAGAGQHDLFGGVLPRPPVVHRDGVHRISSGIGRSAARIACLGPLPSLPPPTMWCGYSS